MPIHELQRMHKLILWLEIFAPNVLVKKNTMIESNIPEDFNVQFYDFLKGTKKR